MKKFFISVLMTAALAGACYYFRADIAASAVRITGQEAAPATEMSSSEMPASRCMAEIPEPTVATVDKPHAVTMTPAKLPGNHVGKSQRVGMTFMRRGAQPHTLLYAPTINLERILS